MRRLSSSIHRSSIGSGRAAPVETHHRMYTSPTLYSGAWSRQKSPALPEHNGSQVSYSTASSCRLYLKLDWVTSGRACGVNTIYATYSIISTKNFCLESSSHIRLTLCASSGIGTNVIKQIPSEPDSPTAPNRLNFDMYRIYHTLPSRNCSSNGWLQIRRRQCSPCCPWCALQGCRQRPPFVQSLGLLRLAPVLSALLRQSRAHRCMLYLTTYGSSVQSISERSLRSSWLSVS